MAWTAILLAAALAADGVVLAPSEAAQCRVQGGKVQRVCLMQNQMCILPYRDAGKVCSDKADCSGNCVYEGLLKFEGLRVWGRCEADNQPCGCRALVVNGRLGYRMCVD